MIQTIIGSGGSIGIPLARALQNHTDQIRLVSRNPKKVNDSDELFPADLYDLTQVDKAIAGSEVVYVTIGFEYKTRVWQDICPRFIQEVINSCKKHQAKLVFFDNVYMYASSEIPFMTESSAIAPLGKKGQVRSQLREMIINEVEKKNLTALIARAADFYGPDCRNSALAIMVANNLMKGKKAQVFGDINKIHTYTYTPDAAIATVLLGNTPDAFNQEWHLPTTKEKLTTLNWIELIANELGTKPDIQIFGNWIIKVLGIFIPFMREFPEMLYHDWDYIFDSSKFEKRFGTLATSPAVGVKTMIENLKQ